MRFFDAHCDAVMHIEDGGFDFVAGKGRSHMDLPRLLAAGHRAQVFAIFAAASYYPGRDLRAFAERAIAAIHGWAAASDGRMQVAARQRKATDKRIADTPSVYTAPAATAGGCRCPFSSAAVAPLLAIIGLEGADPLEGQAENLRHFYDLGVRLVIPAWDDNDFSGSSAGPGDGLTAEGFKLIELCQELGVMVDVSHASDAAFEQIRQIVRGSFVASHSNCRALSPAPRNLTDAQIRALAERGGVMGINLAPDFLSPEYLAAWDAVMAPVRHADAATRQKLREAAGEQLRAIPRPGVDWIARHVRHAIAIGGEDCIGLGGDLDGISFMPAGIHGVEDYPLIPEALAAAGLTESQIEKVCWRNMARVFGEVLG
jgi:membrane dipeptidase